MRFKKIAAVLTATVFIGCGFSAQAQTFGISRKHHQNWPNIKPSHCIRPVKNTTYSVSYNSATTNLTVDFRENSSTYQVEVFRNGSKVAGMSASGNTTFSCTLKDYGEGDYDIIVSSGNTVVYSRNIIIR
jgi:hypothetical protein